MSYDPQNIFAKILRGEIPCDKVFENDHALAFNDISPKAPVHVLIIPKGEYESSTDFSAKASAEELAGFMRAVHAVAEKTGVLADGYRLIANAGDNGHQEVPHFHVHLVGGRPLGAMLQTR
ncbi:MAG: histidine triad nucleotide-binding protein [Gammaproteobacteria bacterium]|jgi:diadenosine tetraphosphate (Ap4A) HIT family hydrolase